MKKVISRKKKQNKVQDKIFFDALILEFAHDMGTCLNVISGRAELAIRRLGKEHMTANDLRIITQQVERASGIVQQLVDVSKNRLN